MYLATSFFYKSELDSASFFYIQATKIAEELNSEKDLIKLYGNLATTYSLLTQHETAQDYYLKGLKLAEKSDNKMAQIKICVNMSNSFFTNKNYEKAILFAQKAVNLSYKISFQVGLYRSLNQLSRAYLSNKEYKKALITVEKVLKVEITDPTYEARVMLNYSKVLFANQRYKAAKINIYKTVQQFYINPNTPSNKMSLQENYLQLSKVYSFLNMPDSAQVFMERGIDLYKEIVTDKMTTETAKVQTQYETEKKEQEIIQLTQQNQIKELELQNSYYLMGVFVVLGLAIMVFIWLFLRQKNMLANVGKFFRRKVISIK